MHAGNAHEAREWAHSRRADLGQVYATLAVAEQLARIADALADLSKASPRTPESPQPRNDRTA